MADLQDDPGKVALAAGQHDPGFRPRAGPQFAFVYPFRHPDGGDSVGPPRGPCESRAPEQARRHVWSDADRELAADRVDTRFTGTPGQVADQLERLRDATEADELIIATITHDHANRVRAYQLLADEWARR